jgi:hypothetical protein
LLAAPSLPPLEGTAFGFSRRLRLRRLGGLWFAVRRLILIIGSARFRLAGSPWLGATTLRVGGLGRAMLDHVHVLLDLLVDVLEQKRRRWRASKKDVADGRSVRRLCHQLANRLRLLVEHTG